MKTKIFRLLLLALLAAVGGACSKGVSYADLLRDENQAVNRFLADQRVIGSVPADSVFICGQDAPYYQLDDEGCIYMKVINPGNPDDRAKADDLVYFRFMSSNLMYYTTESEMAWTGNAVNLDQVLATSFRFGNTTLESSYQWGSGLQMPLYYLGYDCEVFIIIKSLYGPTSLMSSVQPYVYNVRYYRSQI